MTHRSLNLRRRRAVALAVALMAGIAGAGASAAGEPSAASIGQTAPDFALPSIGGSNVRLSEYRGQPVILSFWSSRCSVCARELNLLDRLYGTYRSAGLVVLAISVDDEPQHAEQYARAHATAFPLLLDSGKDVGRSYAIDRLPSSVLIDRSGVVRFRHSDELTDDRSYLMQVRQLLDDAVTAP